MATVLMSVTPASTAVAPTAVLSRMMNRVHPDVVRSHWPGKQDALETIQRVTTWTEDQLQGGLRRTLGSLFR